MRHVVKMLEFLIITRILPRKFLILIVSNSVQKVWHSDENPTLSRRIQMRTFLIPIRKFHIFTLEVSQSDKVSNSDKKGSCSNEKCSHSKENFSHSDQKVSHSDQVYHAAWKVSHPHNFLIMTKKKFLVLTRYYSCTSFPALAVKAFQNILNTAEGEVQKPDVISG